MASLLLVDHSPLPICCALTVGGFFRGRLTITFCRGVVRTKEGFSTLTTFTSHDGWREPNVIRPFTSLLIVRFRTSSLIAPQFRASTRGAHGSPRKCFATLGGFT